MYQDSHAIYLTRPKVLVDRPSSLNLPRLTGPSDASIALLSVEARRLAGAREMRVAPILDWCRRAHDQLAALETPAAIALWQDLLGPYFLKSPFLERARRKPRGYAGDYLTIQMMYDAVPAGETAFAQGVDAWAFEQPCPRAVRNRRFLVHTLLTELAATFPGQDLCVTSLGCGPAAEVFDWCGSAKASFTLVDIDAEAIDFVLRRAQATQTARVIPVLGNLIKMVLGRSIALPGEQHAFYSLGVIDYFGDELVIRLLNYVYERLRIGGVVLLGNFRPGHPNEAFFKHALDWPLRLRSESELLALVGSSRFAGCPVQIGSECEGVQLFVKCTKI